MDSVKKKEEKCTDMQGFLMLFCKGVPHAIFRPRQKRQARISFFSGVFLEDKELGLIDGAEFKRDSVGGGVDRYQAFTIAGTVRALWRRKSSEICLHD